MQTRTGEKKLLNFCVSVIRYRSPSRRRERPGARKANAGTRPMRTLQSYSPHRQHARAKVGAFLHRRTVTTGTQLVVPSPHSLANNDWIPGTGYFFLLRVSRLLPLLVVDA